MNNHNRGENYQWDLLVKRKTLTVETVTQPTAALSTCSAVFIAHAHNTRRQRNCEGKGGSWWSTVDSLGSTVQNEATQAHKHAHKVQAGLTLSIYQKPTTHRDWLLFLAAWKTRELYVYFPLVLFLLWFCCGGSVHICVTFLCVLCEIDTLFIHFCCFYKLFFF